MWLPTEKKKSQRIVCQLSFELSDFTIFNVTAKWMSLTYRCWQVKMVLHKRSEQKSEHIAKIAKLTIVCKIGRSEFNTVNEWINQLSRKRNYLASRLMQPKMTIEHATQVCDCPTVLGGLGSPGRLSPCVALCCFSPLTSAVTQWPPDTQPPRGRSSAKTKQILINFCPHRPLCGLNVFESLKL